jgi:hypothetical protein
MVANGTHSDRTGERRWHVAVPALVAATGWVMVAVLQDPWVVLTGLVLIHAGVMSMLAPFWSLPTSYLSGAAAAGGIALINSIGNLGGAVSPLLMGFFGGSPDPVARSVAVQGLVLPAGPFAVWPQASAALEIAAGDLPVDYTAAELLVAGALVFGAVLTLFARHDATLERQRTA